MLKVKNLIQAHRPMVSANAARAKAITATETSAKTVTPTQFSAVCVVFKNSVKIAFRRQRARIGNGMTSVSHDGTLNAVVVRGRFALQSKSGPAFIAQNGL